MSRLPVRCLSLFRRSQLQFQVTSSAISMQFLWIGLKLTEALYHSIFILKQSQHLYVRDLHLQTEWDRIRKDIAKAIGLLQQTITWYKIRHAGGQAHYYSRTETLKQRDLNQSTMWSFFAKGLLHYWKHRLSVHALMFNDSHEWSPYTFYIEVVTIS